MLKRLALIAAVGLSLAALAGCSKDKNPTSSGGTGTLRVRMTDAPADYDAVNLVIVGVSARMDGGSDSTTGWQTLKADSATYDLLSLRNGVFATIGTGQVPAGHYTQVRLLLGAGSNVVVGGVTHPLTIPSGMQTGLKLVGSFDVTAGELLDLELEFDASRSVIQTGAGTYMLKPTVRVIPVSTAGTIQGSLTPAGTSAQVFALAAADTTGSATAAADGTFKISVLPAGTYSLAFHPASGFRDTTISGVVVQGGATTTVPQVVLTAQ